VRVQAWRRRRRLRRRLLLLLLLLERECFEASSVHEMRRRCAVV
jgi:hypothetical protein